MSSEPLHTPCSSRWLPAPESTLELPVKEAKNARSALTRLWTAWSVAGAARQELLAGHEAYLSSRIGNVNEDPYRADGNQAAKLLSAINMMAGRAPATGDMLDWHATLCEGLPAYQGAPGQYRTEVLGLIQSFAEWRQGNLDPLLRAVYSHVACQAIHPFSAGNGRIGRLLLLQDLGGLPFPVSRRIWWETSTYYRLLSQGNWVEWSQWLLRCISAGANDAIRELRYEAPPAAARFQQTVEYSRQPLKAPPKGASEYEWMRYYQQVQRVAAERRR